MFTYDFFFHVLSFFFGLFLTLMDVSILVTFRLYIMNGVTTIVLPIVILFVRLQVIKYPMTKGWERGFVDAKNW